MNTRCTVCNHPQRAELERDHVAGVTHRELAKRYDRAKSTIQRHLTDHVPSAAQKAQEAADARELEAGDQILSELRNLTSEAQRLQKLAEKKRDYRTAIAAIREIVRVVELKAKILGEIHENEINFSVHVDDATAERMAETFLSRRRLKPAIAVQATPVDAGAVESKSPLQLQVIENEGEK